MALESDSPDGGNSQPISLTVDDTMRRAYCLAMFRDVAATYDEPADRKRFIMHLWQSRIISDGAAELLIEHFALEGA